MSRNGESQHAQLNIIFFFIYLGREGKKCFPGRFSINILFSFGGGGGLTDVVRFLLLI